VRVLVANSELAIKRGDHDAAVMMLSSVPSSSPAYAKAQMVKADIFLQYRKDKMQYARCYQVHRFRPRWCCPNAVADVDHSFAFRIHRMIGTGGY
jgi:hypothetical protein